MYFTSEGKKERKKNTAKRGREGEGERERKKETFERKFVQEILRVQWPRLQTATDLHPKCP